MDQRRASPFEYRRIFDAKLIALIQSPKTFQRINTMKFFKSAATIPGHPMQRREFLRTGQLLLAAPVVAAGLSAVDERPTSVRVGLITDLHYADKDPAGSRFYRETLKKLDEAGAQFEKDRPDFLVELGDFIDAADSVDVELSYLKTINKKFAALAKDRHYVLGNHCVDTLTKDEFLGAVEKTKSWYSFSHGPAHFVVLDSCFRSDGQPYGRKNSEWTDANVPPEQLEWLQAELAESPKPVILFAHQRLDVSTAHGVRNGAAVRSILEASRKVACVFQGHSHQNDLTQINGISYCTLVAMVEGSGVASSGYSMLHVSSDGSIRLQGFRNQNSRELSSKE